MILKCNCSNSYQDKLYGKGMRIHNICSKDPRIKQARCTVCGKVKNI